jgi:hypothetical protein
MSIKIINPNESNILLYVQDVFEKKNIKLEMGFL